MVCELLDYCSKPNSGLSRGHRFMNHPSVYGTAALTILLASLLASAGCGSTTTPTQSTPVTYEQKTETYSGTLNVGETKAFHFAVTNPGSLDAAITSLSPIATLTMGLNLNFWDAAAEACPRSTVSSEVARVNAAISGTPQQAGEYCVSIFDVGNVPAAGTDFTIIVLHY
jgi:hypothetical protein